MNKIIIISLSIIFACNSIFGQSNDEIYRKDVESVDAIMNAYYDVVSGSSNEPWEFYEKELKRKVSKYGNVAQVWSAFEIRTDPNTETNIRGLNSVQLHYESGRWWIDSWTCEMESEKSSVVSEFLNKE